MNHKTLFALKRWYEQRTGRERIFFSLLNLAILYAIFYIFLLGPLDSEKIALTQSIKEANDKINTWNTQINTLNKIANSPLYKKWVTQQKAFKQLQSKYKYFIQTASPPQWQNIIKTVLRSQTNITLDQIKNFPETLYQPSMANLSSNKIYQQRMLLVFYSNYFDTIHYLQRLEELLPNIRWESLTYEVTQYPVAKVEMEFSILYEKHQP